MYLIMSLSLVSFYFTPQLPLVLFLLTVLLFLMQFVYFHSSVTDLPSNILFNYLPLFCSLFVLCSLFTRIGLLYRLGGLLLMKLFLDGTFIVYSNSPSESWWCYPFSLMCLLMVSVSLSGPHLTFYI